MRLTARLRQLFSPSTSNCRKPQMNTIDATEARLSTHEEVCAIRYEQINARLKRIEAILMKTAGLMIVAMGGTIFSVVWITK